MTTTPPPLPRVGQLDATVQLLTIEQARAEVPHLLGDDDADPYFNLHGAHGNAEWKDYHPDWVVVVRNLAGEVVLASNASRWHLKALGYAVPKLEWEGR